MVYRLATAPLNCPLGVNARKYVVNVTLPKATQAS